MWKSLFFLAAFAFACAELAVADTQCTTQKRAAWQKASSLRQDLEQKGFRITRLVVSQGRCYEVHGFNSANRPVRLFFDPVNGTLVAVARVSPS